MPCANKQIRKNLVPIESQVPTARFRHYPVLPLARLLTVVFLTTLTTLTLGQTASPTTSSPKAGSRTPITSALSQYERDVVSRVLKERKVTVDENPEGKWIERIDVETLDVFEPEDPLPGWVNWFHATSREEVIKREILLREGQRFSSDLANETARNLRGLKQLSVVLILPIQCRDGERVRLLVITKDVWSLRLNSAYRMKNGVFEYLLLQPAEENLLGQHLRISAQYIYDQSTNTFGATVSHQRLFGSRIAVIANVNAIEHRSTNRLEGTSGTFFFGQPLYSTRAKWAWGTSVVWNHRVIRRLTPTPDGGYVARRFNDPSTPENENIPYRYRAHELSWQTAVTRSYGVTTKTNLTFGLEAVERKYNAQNLIRDGYAKSAIARFEEQKLERSNVRLGPFAMLEAYQNRYISLYDVETLGLQEDFQLGPRIFIKAYSGAKRTQSTRDLLGVSNGIEYTASYQGSLGRIWAIHTAEISPTPSDSDGLIQTGLRLISPRLGVGRFVYDTGAVYRYLDYRNLRYGLGGDNRLRGYPSQQFLGRNLIASNLEFRTRSIKLFEILFGLVGFYDVGDAFDAPEQLRPKHSVGFGARATAPQLQRIAARLDVAFPLTPPPPNAPLGERWGGVDILLTLDGQAFPFPTAQPSSYRTPLITAD